MHVITDFSLNSSNTFFVIFSICFRLTISNIDYDCLNNFIQIALQKSLFRKILLRNFPQKKMFFVI